jgi:hypothetical protein
MKKVHVCSVMSESSDHYGPFVFEKKPTDRKLLAFLKERCGSEADETANGPGWKGTYLHLDWSVQVVQPGK